MKNPWFAFLCGKNIIGFVNITSCRGKKRRPMSKAQNCRILLNYSGSYGKSVLQCKCELFFALHSMCFRK